MIRKCVNIFDYSFIFFYDERFRGLYILRAFLLGQIRHGLKGYSEKKRFSLVQKSRKGTSLRKFKKKAERGGFLRFSWPPLEGNGLFFSNHENGKRQKLITFV